MEYVIAWLYVWGVLTIGAMGSYISGEPKYSWLCAIAWPILMPLFVTNRAIRNMMKTD